jgi:hypothetical protein
MTKLFANKEIAIMKFKCFALLTSVLLLAIHPSAVNAEADSAYDVVVYGGTAGGAIAAIQSARMGKTVVLIERGKHIGGLTTGGLGATDIGNKGAIGGMSRRFYERIGEHYSKDASWNWQTRDSFNSRRQVKGDKAMWTFEPHVAENVLNTMLAKFKVPVLFSERLNLNSGVKKVDGRIVSITMKSGKTFAGKMFIDATYEGDLMAKAGVDYHVGREANATYGETLNGLQIGHAVKHQFNKAVDPFVIKGDPTSGLLPGVQPQPKGVDGQGDHRVQAYCFRMCTTNVKENSISWPKPENYDERQFELVLRNCEAGDTRFPWHPTYMPNRKTDTNNNFAISTDNLGMNYDYPDGDYATREKIIAEHTRYQQGLMWTLANHPRVPQAIRDHFQSLRLAKDEFVDNGNWPHQIYVREARRMVSEYVMSQQNCQGRKVADDSVALAAYTMDSHNVQRYAKDGRVWNEGDVQVGGFAPYPISYRSIRPKKTQCQNLLVPVAMSASHIAYGSIRMEPVFMVLGQSAATAAVHAIDDNVAVQDIDIKKLQSRLLEDKQVLEWTGRRPVPSILIGTLKGIVVDDRISKRTGQWIESRSTGGFVEFGYLHDGNTAKGEMKAVFRPKLPVAGKYEVSIAHAPNPNRATNVPVTIETANGTKTVTLNQRTAPKNGKLKSIGTFQFAKGTAGSVTISNSATNGYVILDAVQFVLVP